MPDSVEVTFAVTLHYGQPLMRRVVFAYYRRTVGIAFPLVLVAMTGLIALGASQHGMNWFLAVLAAVVILGTLLAGFIFVAHYRHTLTRFRQLKSAEATLVANHEQFTVVSDLGTSFASRFNSPAARFYRTHGRSSPSALCPASG